MTVENMNSEALGRLRSTLINTLEIAPLSEKPKKATHRALKRVPDWILDAWSNALDIDYANRPRKVWINRSEAFDQMIKYQAQAYLEEHDAVAAGNCLEQLVKKALKLGRDNGLPVDKDMVERGICALALAPLTLEGMEFARQANYIIRDKGDYHVLVNYQLALELGDKDKLEAVDKLLSGSDYGEWVADRIIEAKRWFGLEAPHFNINSEERSPLWDKLWGNIVKGGNNEREDSRDLGTG